MKKILVLICIVMMSIQLIGNAATKIEKELKKQEQKQLKIEKNKEKELKKKAKENEKATNKQNKNIEKENEKFKKLMKSYELEAVIKTNKGDITVYLYPEAAPINVANFVYLASKGYYDGLKFHRVIQNALIQGGDKEGTGEGNPGYKVNDEVVDWLNFDNAGILAMANTGPNTNGSQFFITMASLSQINDKYTIIGSIISREDLSIVKIIRESDTIISVDIKGNKVNTFLDNFKEEIEEWNKNKNF